MDFKQFTLDHITEAIYWTDETAKIYDVNDAACNALGYTRDELLELTIKEIDHESLSKTGRNIGSK
jgi:PAS domain S-box-containing protein